MICNDNNVRITPTSKRFIRRGLMNQLRHNQSVDKIKPEIQLLFNKLNVTNWEGKTLTQIVSNVYQWPEFQTLQTKIPDIIKACHEKAKKNNEKALALFRKGKEAEKNWKNHNIRQQRWVALKSYTEAMMNAQSENKSKESYEYIFIKALAGRTRLLPLEDKLDATYLLFALSGRANSAILVAEILTSKAKLIRRRLKQLNGKGGHSSQTMSKTKKNKIIKLKQASDKSLQKAAMLICQAMSICEKKFSKNKNTKSILIIPRAARLLSQINAMDPNALIPKPINNLKSKKSSFMTTDVYKNVDVDSGPNLKANKDIKKGNIIFFEPPVAFRHKNYLCPGCWRKVQSSIWPCLTCNEVYYCREMCQITDKHSRMCTFTKFIHSSVGSLGFLTSQLITRATTHEVLSLGKGRSIRDILNQINNVNDPSHLSCTFNLFNAMYAQEIYNLQQDHKVDALMLSITIQLALFIIEHLATTEVQEASFMKENKHMLNDEEKIDYIVAVYRVYRCLFNLSVANSFMLNKFDVDIGIGFGSFGARIEQNCHANVVYHLSNNGTIVYKACQPIKAGEKLTIACRGRKFYNEGKCCANQNNRQPRINITTTTTTTTTTTNNNNTNNHTQS